MAPATCKLWENFTKLTSLNMSIAALKSSNVAVITGGASGIGFAAAVNFARRGMRICIADLGAARLAAAAKAVKDSGGEAMTVECDVGRFADLASLEASVRARFGPSRG